MTQKSAHPQPPSKPHFPVLDGLRGVAALAVVTFHFFEMVIGNYKDLWIGHGFLAVDFFFCLSGFVMGYAYLDRLRTLSLRQFMVARLTRLHPLVLLGSVLGLLAFYFNPYGVPPGYTPARVALLFTASVLLIPYGTMPSRGFNLFSLNAPAWSLFWEYVANLLFAAGLYRLRRPALAMLTIVAGLLLCWAGHRAGNLSGGWSARNFWVGGVRMAYSFLAGLLVYRIGWRPRTLLGFGTLSLLLCLASVLPYRHGAWPREAAIILLYFPLLTALAAGAVVSKPVHALCRFSGDLSYPLYMTHYSVIWIWGDLAAKHHLAGASLFASVAAGVLLMLLVACAALKLYDEPVRAWLQRRSRPSPQSRA